MKSHACVLSVSFTNLLVGLLLTCSVGGLAQTPPTTLPAVILAATDPDASQSGNTGTFTFYRFGDTNQALNLLYRIGGSASNGVDYATIGNSITIDAGSRSNTLTITPINPAQAALVTTVHLELIPSSVPTNYMIGFPAAGTVYIQAVLPSNVPPVVRLVSPMNGASFISPVDIFLLAHAEDLNGFDTIQTVEFFSGTTSLGITTNRPVANPIGPFYLIWSNAPPGNYVLTAVATDNQGAMGTSAPVNISVLTGPPPPTNFPPLVNIVSTDPLAIEGTNCWIWPGPAVWPGSWTNWPFPVPVWHTNCGPKSAFFTVHRFGDTNNDLTLLYELGGSATNGVDYATLSGMVTIPAGSRRATIEVAPLDDGPPDLNSTVVAKLLPDTNTPPAYLLAWPRYAAALIFDGQFPHPVTGFDPDGTFHLNQDGPDGAWFHIDWSTDLTNWTGLCTNQVINGSIDFIDPDAAGHPTRFYRTVPSQAPPQGP